MSEKRLNALTRPLVVTQLLLLAFLAGSVYQRPAFGPGGVPLAGWHQQGAQNDRAARWRTDLRVLAEELPRYHANAFHAVSAGKFRAQVRALDAKLAFLSDDQITVELIRLVALIGDGHTNVSSWPDRFHRYPFRLAWFGRELRVMEVLPEAKRALGARLVRVGQTAVEDAYARVRPLASRETELDSRNDSTYLLPRAEVLAALRLLPSERQGRFTFQDDAGRTFVLTLKPRAPEAAYNAAWQSVTLKPPLFEQRSDDAFWFTTLEQGRTVYIKYNRCEDEEGFARFTKKVLGAVDRPQTRRVVVDLRDNGGGDTSVIRPLLDGLQERGYGERKGSLVALTNRFTYSAGMWAANDLKNLGAVLVGEPSS